MSCTKLIQEQQTITHTHTHTLSRQGVFNVTCVTMQVNLSYTSVILFSPSDESELTWEWFSLIRLVFFTLHIWFIFVLEFPGMQNSCTPQGGNEKDDWSQGWKQTISRLSLVTNSSDRFVGGLFCLSVIARCGSLQLASCLDCRARLRSGSGSKPGSQLWECPYFGAQAEIR